MAAFHIENDKYQISSLVLLKDGLIVCKYINYKQTNNSLNFGCNRIINNEVIMENVIQKAPWISTSKYATQNLSLNFDQGSCWYINSRTLKCSFRASQRSICYFLNFKNFVY